MTKQTKSLLKKIILLTLAIMTPLTLFFSVLKVRDGDYSLSYNGFSFLDFKYFRDGELFDIASTCGVFSIFQLLFSFIVIIKAIITFSSKSNYVEGKLIISFSLIVSVLYLIEGLIFKQRVISMLHVEGSYVDQYIKTFCFVPIIIQSVLSIAYCVITNYLPDTTVKTTTVETPKTTTINPDTNDTTISDKFILLKQYKELFDTGVITQEEFDEKKKEIL